VVKLDVGLSRNPTEKVTLVETGIGKR